MEKMTKDEMMAKLMTALELVNEVGNNLCEKHDDNATTAELTSLAAEAYKQIAAMRRQMKTANL